VQKCNMDRNAAPDYVEPSPKASVDTTLAIISHIRGLTPDPPTALVQPILTPRFAISCTPALLSDLSRLVRSDRHLAIQTHISENPSEVDRVKELFPPSVLPPLPGGRSRGPTTYAGVYDAYGLLRDNTILAHAVHLEESEVALIAARKAAISHCPTSNFNLRSGIAPVGVFLDRGIKVCFSRCWV
jgi:guanine deaminase